MNQAPGVFLISYFYLKLILFLKKIRNTGTLEHCSKALILLNKVLDQAWINMDQEIPIRRG